MGTEPSRPVPSDWRAGFLVERFNPVRWGRRAGAEERGKGSAAEGDDEIALPPYGALRTADWLSVEYATDERELLDLPADPYQLANLASTVPTETIEGFAAHLAVPRECAAAVRRTAEETPLDPATLAG